MDARGDQIRKPVTAYKNALLSRYSFSLYLTQNFISCPATFVRRDAWHEAGLLSTDLRFSMDYDLFLRLAKRSDPVILHRDLAFFRMVEGTLSMSHFEQQFEEHMRVSATHGTGHAVAVGVNRVNSRAIIAAYSALRWRRTHGDH